MHRYIETYLHAWENEANVAIFQHLDELLIPLKSPINPQSGFAV
jgi:hypothetical protein